MVAFRPVFTAATRPHVHHILLHACEANTWWNAHLNSPQPCRSDASTAVSSSSDGASPFGVQGCSGLVWAWAVGQGDFILPSEAGFLMDSTKKNIVMEIHYDNPGGLQNRIDSVGVEIYYVNTLRTHNAGILSTGDPLVQLNSQPSTAIPGFETGQLPAGTASILRQGTCPSACTSTLDGTSSMTVFGLFHHMHYTGQRIHLEHYNSAGVLQTRRWRRWWISGTMASRS